MVRVSNLFDADLAFISSMMSMTSLHLDNPYDFEYVR